MDLFEIAVDDLIPYENNPRLNDEAVDAVAASIREFGFKVPIVIDKNNVIVCGHTRMKAAVLLGLDTVPAIRADDLTDEQVKAFRLADNKTAELADWDFDALSEELAKLQDMDMSEFGFDMAGITAEIDNNPYTTEIKIPQYQIQGEQPEIDDLYDTKKTDELIDEISKSKVSKQEKAFLIEAAKRHNKFNYQKIAEYYAGASKEMQRLMEKSALVILDYADAIANGFIELSSRLKLMREENAG